MPAIVPFIPLIIGAASVGTSTGLALSGAGQPSPNAGLDQQNKLLEQQKQQQAQSDAQAKQKAILANLANSQEQTGGNVGNNTLVDLASIIAGLPGEASGAPGKGALASFLGTGGGGGGGGTSTGSGTETNLVNQTFFNGGQG
jgi:hypothetical protein